MWREVAADEVRGAAADAPRPRTGAGGVDQRRIVGEAQVVVAAEADQVASLDTGERAARSFERAPAALESVALETGQIAGAAVDVFPKEPRSKGEEFVSPLRGMSRPKAVTDT